MTKAEDKGFEQEILRNVSDCLGLSLRHDQRSRASTYSVQFLL